MTALAEAPRELTRQEKFNQHTFKPGDPRASLAGKKSTARRAQLLAIANGKSKALLLPATKPRLTQLQRVQRRLISQCMGETDASKMLEAAKAARELFEMEMELLGRRPLKAGKVPRGATAEQTRKALALPDAATLPRPDSLDCAPPGYDPHAGLPFNPAGGNTSFTPLPLDPGATKQTAPRPAPGEQNRVAGTAQTVPLAPS